MTMITATEDYSSCDSDAKESYRGIESNEVDDENSDALEELSENEDQDELLNAVLSKAKKLTDIKKEKPKPVSFEVETENGKIKEEKIDSDQLDKKPASRQALNEPPRKKKRELPNLRVKPDILEKDRERTLQRIATKGVVQLFNAVKMQQKEIGGKLKEAGPLEVKKEAILKNLDKRTFLDVLMGEKSENIDDSNQAYKTRSIKRNEPEKDTTWSVLKDDFMMTAKMKDWDKNLDIAEEHNTDSD
ncbi:hypothetical protein NQ317_000210 [Molorchus minor]|uniref:RRP15-like protein n=1 Tax=Molorchus minor TaxID=1323400 RepID=A0ABQ9JBY4_9CUCU|nr:hypothetical protein NQ317_000210 [Molorchus minor]